MKRWYKQFARKTYRYLRNPKRRRENRLFGWLGNRVLNRDLWHPERHAIALGASIGLTLSMLPPIPIQMLLAAFLAVFFRANIPIAAAACWFSNPLTWGPIIWWQNHIGDRLLHHQDGMSLAMHEIRCWALGAVILAVIIAPVGYALVATIWHLVIWIAQRSAPVVAPVVAPVIASVKKGEKQNAEKKVTTQVTTTADP